MRYLSSFVNLVAISSRYFTAIYLLLAFMPDFTNQLPLFLNIKKGIAVQSLLSIHLFAMNYSLPSSSGKASNKSASKP